MGYTIVGLGPGDGRYLSDEGRRAISQAAVVGSERRYAEIASRLAPKASFVPFEGDADAFAGALMRKAEGAQAVILASGDPLLYSLGSAMVERLPAAELSVIPGLSSFQVLCALAGFREDNAELASLHTLNPKLPADQALAARIVDELEDKRPVALFLRPGFDAAWVVARLASRRGWDCEAALGIELGTPDQKLIRGTLRDLKGIEQIGRGVMFVKARSSAVARGRRAGKQTIAVVAVSFGTSKEESIERCIKPCEEALLHGQGELSLVRAFSSERVRAILAARGRPVPNTDEALLRLATEGYERVVVQPLHIIPGEEFHKVLAQCAPHRHRFSRLCVAEPFLSSGSGFDEAVAALDALYPAPIDGRALLLMGHGSEHPANGLYSMLEAKLADLGPGRFVANVEGYPGIERAIKRLRSRGIASVDIAPLMLVAGVHVYEDMVGDDEGSWINLLGRAGIEARPILHGLGEDEAVRRVFASRLKATLTRLREDTPAIGHGVGASTP